CGHPCGPVSASAIRCLRRNYPLARPPSRQPAANGFTPYRIRSRCGACRRQPCSSPSYSRALAGLVEHLEDLLEDVRWFREAARFLLVEHDVVVDRDLERAL